MALEEIIQRLDADDEELRRAAVAALAGHPLAATLPLIFGAMGDVSWRVRKEAVETLFRGEPPGLEAVEGLIDLLRSSENAGLRNCAVESLERLGRIAVEPLCRYLDDRDPDLRKFVIDILGSIGAPSCLPLLVRKMDDPDPNVSVGAVENLGKLKDPRAVPHLLAALQTGDLWLKFTVLDALAAIGVPVPLETLKPLVHETLLKRAIYECLGVVAGAEAAPLLIEGVQQGPRNAREAAAVGLMRLRARLTPEEACTAVDRPLRRLNGTAQVAGLVSALDGVEPQGAEALVEILGLIGDEVCVARLVSLSENERVRGGALRALRRIGPAALPKLTELFPQASVEARAFIAYVFGELGLSQTAPVLLAALDEDAPLVRCACLSSLGRLHPRGGARQVARFADAAEPEVREAALQALLGFAQHDAAELSAICHDFAGSADPARRRDAAAILARLGEGELLTRLAKDEDAEVRRAALLALGKARLPQTGSLVMGLMDEDADVRAAAALALGEAGGADGIEALTLSLSDPDPHVQCASLKALAALGDASALPAVAAAAGRAAGLVLIQALKTLAALGGEGGLAPVRDALANPDEEVVEAAIEILAGGDPSWISCYHDVLAYHPHWGVRRSFFRAMADLLGDGALPALREAALWESDPLVKGELEKLVGRLS